MEVLELREHATGFFWEVHKFLFSFFGFLAASDLEKTNGESSAARHSNPPPLAAADLRAGM